LLIAHGLARQDAERRAFSITDAGLAALGPDAPQRPAPWVRSEMVSAANARDVRRRMEHRNDDRSAAERSRHGSMAAAKALATANRQQPFIDTFTEIDRMAG
jgi:hypothetical protein